MSAQVVSLDSKRPHSTFEGEARCLNCQHRWEAVQQIEADMSKWLECPQCHLARGQFFRGFVPAKATWQCDCGNDLMLIVEDGLIFCPNCGNYQANSNGFMRLTKP